MDRPGELVHMDVKELGKIPDGGGWKPRAARPRRPPRNAFAHRHSTDLKQAVAQLGDTDRGAALAPFLEFHNTRRRHTALDGLLPASRPSPTC